MIFQRSWISADTWTVNPTYSNVYNPLRCRWLWQSLSILLSSPETLRWIIAMIYKIYKLYKLYFENALFWKNLFLYSRAWFRQTKCIVMMTEEESTNIVLMTHGVGDLVLRSDHISIIVKMLYFFKNLLLYTQAPRHRWRYRNDDQGRV